jgi:hypothetical protein
MILQVSLNGRFMAKGSYGKLGFDMARNRWRMRTTAVWPIESLQLRELCRYGVPAGRQSGSWQQSECTCVFAKWAV